MSASSNGAAFGVADLIGAAFVILKVVHVEPINHWSWWMVTSPFWGQLAAASIILLFIGLVAGIVSIFD
jgi:hypothetical protein